MIGNQRLMLLCWASSHCSLQVRMETRDQMWAGRGKHWYVKGGRSNWRSKFWNFCESIPDFHLHLIGVTQGREPIWWALLSTLNTSWKLEKKNLAWIYSTFLSPTTTPWHPSCNIKPWFSMAAACLRQQQYSYNYLLQLIWDQAAGILSLSVSQVLIYF